MPSFAIGDIYVPANPYVPVSLQTLSALVVGATLGFRRGISATTLYLVLGCIGLPVFAINSQGTHESSFRQIASVTDGHLVLGTTGGYLIGFVLAAGLVGRLAELGWDRRLRGSIAAMVLGLVVIFGLGMVWLSHRGLPGPGPDAAVRPVAIPAGRGGQAGHRCRIAAHRLAAGRASRPRPLARRRPWPQARMPVGTEP